MTTRDYRDGSGISFVPKERQDTRGGRAGGIVALLLGLSLLVSGLVVEAFSSPVKNMNVTSMGVLIGFQDAAEGQTPGDYAMVSFDPPGAPSVAVSHTPVEEGKSSTNQVGRTYAVYYNPDDLSQTFIDGIDKLERQWPMLVGGGALGLLGLGLVVRPPGRAEDAPKVRLRWK